VCVIFLVRASKLEPSWEEGGVRVVLCVCAPADPTTGQQGNRDATELYGVRIDS
jgi:hypothetical protein